MSRGPRSSGRLVFAEGRGGMKMLSLGDGGRGARGGQTREVKLVSFPRFGRPGADKFDAEKGIDHGYPNRFNEVPGVYKEENGHPHRTGPRSPRGVGPRGRSFGKRGRVGLSP